MRMLTPWERRLVWIIHGAWILACVGTLLLPWALVSWLMGWPRLCPFAPDAICGLVLVLGGSNVAFFLERFLPRSGLLHR
jgi:hypothetical protein